MGSRGLADLYVQGTDLVLDDGKGEPVAVFVRKLTPADHRKAVKYANIARFRVMALRFETESDAYVDVFGPVLELDRGELIDQLVGGYRGEQLLACEAELAAEEEWAKDSRLDDLRGAWEGGLNAAHAKDSEDPEAHRVLKEITRFNDRLNALVEERVSAFRLEHEQLTLSDLRAAMVKRMAELEGSFAWLQEFRRSQIWLATRGPDRKTRLLESREDVDSLSETTLSRLRAAFQSLDTDETDDAPTPVEAESSAAEVSDAPAELVLVAP